MKQMHTLVLIRETESTQGTEGIIYIPHLGMQFFTLELPWKDNKTEISCIPMGTYCVEIRQSQRFKIIYHVQNVPDRSSILIHWGNLAGDTSLGLKTNVKGCILLGKKRGILSGQRAVLVSKVAVREFMSLMKNSKFILEIQGA